MKSGRQLIQMRALCRNKKVSSAKVMLSKFKTSVWAQSKFSVISKYTSNKAPRTMVMYIRKGCVCMGTLCDYLLIDDIVRSITNHSNLCMCNFSMTIGYDFNFSVSIIIHEDLSFDYMLYIELQLTPIGMYLP